MKNVTWTVVALLPLLALAPTHAFAGATQESQTVAEKTAEGVDKTKEAVVKGAKITAEETKEGLSKTGEVMTDAWITTRVHARFVDEKLLKNSDISVDADNHVVTLTGTVMGRAGRSRATVVARGTEGVHRVVNRLTIGPKLKS